MDGHIELPVMVRRAFVKAQLRDGPPFNSVAAIRLYDAYRLREAAAFAKGPDMIGRCVQTNANFDDSICWDFESIEDAVLFRLKFNGVAERPTDLEKFILTGRYK